MGDALVFEPRSILFERLWSAFVLAIAVDDLVLSCFRKLKKRSKLAN
jgi:hypothetical protein